MRVVVVDVRRQRQRRPRRPRRRRRSSTPTDLAALMVTYPSTHGVYEEQHRRHLRDRARARRPGVPRRREPQRARRRRAARQVRRRRVAPQPAQDVLHPARRRRSRRRPDRRARAPRAVPAEPPAAARRGPGERRGAISAAPWGSAGHPADLVGVHHDDGRRRAAARDAGRDPQRELPRAPARAALPGALHRRERSRRARVHHRPPADHRATRA